MSMSYLKDIRSHEVVPPSILIVFDVHSHRPNGILPSLPICVGGKVTNVEVEIVDANIDYNILLGHN